jgi:hypothetical protein
MGSFLQKKSTGFTDFSDKESPQGREEHEDTIVFLFARICIH